MRTTAATQTHHRHQPAQAKQQAELVAQLQRSLEEHERAAEFSEISKRRLREKVWALQDEADGLKQRVKHVWSTLRDWQRRSEEWGDPGRCTSQVIADILGMLYIDERLAFLTDS